MPDSIQKPNVLTKIKIGNFVLKAYAYRSLTKQECQQAAGMWLSNTKHKSFPENGSGEVYTIFGACD